MNPVFLHGSRSGFQIPLDPDPVSVPGSRILGKKECRKYIKVTFIRKRKNEKEMGKATISYYKSP